MILRPLKRFLTSDWWMTITNNGEKVLSSNDFSDSDVARLASAITVDQIDVTDPAWQEGEDRLILVKKSEDTPVFEGAAQLIDIFAPPEVETGLSNQSGWENETKTLTGNNFFGQLGKAGQLRILPDGTICHCITSTNGDESSANGSATYRRNRAVDCLDPLNNAQDSNVCDLLNPARTGGNTDDGWDLLNNTKSVSIPARWGTWWKDTGGYTYFCFAVSGAVTFWWRTGTPEAIYRYISSTTHPNLAENLLEHDFSAGPYEDQSGDETTVHDQIFYDSGSRRTFAKRAVGLWEETTADRVSWENVTDKPEEFPPSGHHHDDLYVSKAEFAGVVSYSVADEEAEVGRWQCEKMISCWFTVIQKKISGSGPRPAGVLEDAIYRLVYNPATDYLQYAPAAMWWAEPGSGGTDIVYLEAGTNEIIIYAKNPGSGRNNGDTLEWKIQFNNIVEL